MIETPTVAFARCPSYAYGVEQAVRRVLHELGGLQRFVQPGQRVLLKPNLLSDREPDRAVTTHPEVVRCLLRLVRECDASPVVADSPANAAKLERVWERTGLGELCRREEVPLLNLEQAGSRAFETDGFRFTLARPALEADVIISLPKVKTHALTMLTAAMKNLYGLVPGYQKTHLHKLYPRPEVFGRLLRHIYAQCPPQLTLADAVVGMQGDGPHAGDPAPLGFLAASADAEALDLALCKLLRIEPSAVPYLRGVRGDGRQRYRVAGVSPAELRPKSFKLPSTLPARLIPGPLVRLLGRLLWIRPGFNDRCVHCGRCVEACPVSALSLPAKQQPPVLDGPLCIGCCCCHEICPHNAIDMTQSPLLHRLRPRGLI